jgi:hypothetical protein
MKYVILSIVALELILLAGFLLFICTVSDLFPRRAQRRYWCEGLKGKIYG